MGAGTGVGAEAGAGVGVGSGVGTGVGVMSVGVGTKTIAVGAGVVGTTDGIATGVSVAMSVGAGEAVDVAGLVVARVSSPAQAARTIAVISADAISMRFPRIPGMVKPSLRFGRALVS